jgi:hypothetical protein
MTPEAAAESICAIIRDSGEHRKTMMRETLRMLFERKHGSYMTLTLLRGLILR